MSRIQAVVFDVGETLVDETRHWGEWADWLGVPRLTFFAALGGVIARGEHHRRVFELVRPGLDIAAETARRAANGWTYRFEPTDFYPDALPCLRCLREARFALGIAGNQPQAAEAALANAGLEVDFLASSARWGVEKPDPAFFSRVVAEARVPAHAVAYVGDRLDNDVLPARRAGLFAVFLRRGPWATLQGLSADASLADLSLDDLTALPAALLRLD